jgi:hypothetical protein
MNITPSGNAAGSGINRQAQNVAPAPGVAGDDPVTSSQIRGSHPIDAVALSNANGFATIDTTRPSIDANAVAVNGEALSKCRRSGWHDGFANTQKGASKDQGESPFHNHLHGLTHLAGTLRQTVVLGMD